MKKRIDPVDIIGILGMAAIFCCALALLITAVSQAWKT